MHTTSTMLSTTNCVALPVGRLTSYKNHLHVDMRLKLKTCPEDCSPPKHAGADLLQCRGNSWTVHHLLCLASSMQLHLARVALLTLGSLQGASAPRPPVAPAPALQAAAALAGMPTAATPPAAADTRLLSAFCLSLAEAMWTPGTEPPRLDAMGCKSCHIKSLLCPVS